MAALVLAGKLRRDLAAKEHLDVPAIGACAMKVLVEYDWPENVRQLESVLHYALVMASASGEKAILAGICRRTSRARDQSPDARLWTAALRGALVANAWNTRKVAGIFGVDRKTVQRKKKEYGTRRDADA
jgi:DNA-binding NtrC family response regulator